MTRLLAFVVHNWPLKLAALVLASLLYGILVIAQDTRQVPVQVEIRPRNQPGDVQLLAPLPDVTRVRYFAPDDVPVTSSSFIATVDLGAPGVGTGITTVNVELEPVDPRVEVFEWEPRQISVTLDEIVTQPAPVRVVTGEIPAGLDVRPPEIDRESIQVSGPASLVQRVDRAEARVPIEPAGIDINRDVVLVPVDTQGDPVLGVDVEPPAVHVRIAVLTDGQTRTVPVTPVVEGSPAPGFELASIVVDPLVVTIEGDADELAAVTTAPTAPISIEGATETIERDVELALPVGVLTVGDGMVGVRITLRAVAGTRTFSAGVALEGALADRTYTLSTNRVLVTLGGSVADLDRLESREFNVEAAVGGLGPGQHEVPITADLPAGLTLDTASPPSVIVTVGQPPSPSPAPAASPAASP